MAPRALPAVLFVPAERRGYLLSPSAPRTRRTPSRPRICFSVARTTQRLPQPRQHDVFYGALQALAHALQAKDPYTAGHSLRVSHIAKWMARELGFAPTLVRQVGIAADLHDIGKIGIAEELLHKAGRLTEAEYHQVMRHTTIGEEIVAPLLGDDQIVRQVVRWHHEHVDGGGGPDGLRGEEIPLAARIVAVADAFDAMTSARPYRNALSLDVARRELRRESGSHFDPMCVAALEALHGSRE
jgi:putative two-component system response regulator